MITLTKHSSARTAIIALVLTLSVFAISINTLPSLVSSLARQLSVSPDRFGVVFFVQYAAYFVCSYLAGLLVSRGYQRLHVVIIAGLFGAGLVLGFVGIVGSMTGLLLILVVVGGGGGLVESASSALLSQFERAGTSRLMNLSQFFFCGGALTAPFITGLLLHYDRSVAFVGLVIGGLAVTASFIVVGLFAVAGVSRIGSSRDPASPFETRSTEPQNTEIEANSPPTNGHDLSQRRDSFGWLLVAIFTYVLLESSVASWLPLYSESGRGASTSFAAIVLTVFWLSVALNRLFFSFFYCRSLYRALILHIGGILLAVAVLVFGSGLVFLLPGVVLLGVACGPVWPMLVSYCGHLYGRKHRVMYMVSVGSLGALMGPITTSAIFSRLGVEQLFVIVAVYALFLLGSFAGVPRQ